MDVQKLTLLSKIHHEPTWFTEQRTIAFKEIKKLEPLKLQRFSYSNWALDKINDVFWQESNPNLYQEESNGKIRVVQLGQSTIKLELPKQLSNQGVILTDIFTAIREYPTLVKKYFFSVFKFNEEKFLAYNLAFLNNGLFLYVPDNLEIKNPIEFELIQDSTIKNTLVSHLLIIAGKNSNLKFLQHLSTIGKQKNNANLIVEIQALASSHLEFSSIDEIGANSTFYFNRRANIGRDAHVEWNIAFMNDCNTVGDLASELVGEGGYAYSKAIAITTGNQNVAVNNRVINRAPHTTGLINQRGVLLENSKLIFNGIGQIVHGAHGSKADQQNRVLMMSDKAQGDANPLLLIDENDVIAAHAASVGPVDQIQMNYLMSRGIPYTQAERMVIHGFLDAVLGSIPKGKVKNRMLKILERKLINGQKSYYQS